MAYAWLGVSVMRAGAIIFVAVLAFAAATAASGRQRMAGSAALAPIIVTRDGSLPRRCNGPRGVALLIARFADAFTRGDQRRLRRFFDYYFQGYSVNEETDGGWKGAAFAHKAPLLRYFRQRHTHAETLSPLIIESTPYGAMLPNAVSISFWLNRSADDLAAKGITQPLAYGKGLVDCRRKTIVIFRVGMPQKAPVPAPYWPYLSDCPLPAGWDPSQGIVACVTRD
jgi:hypothetical protein